MKPDDLFLSYPFDQELARANQGDLTATLRVGYRYYTGTAGVYDPAKACQFLSSISSQAAPASAWLAYITCRLYGSRDPGRTAISALKALATSGDPMGQTLMGRTYHRGNDGVPQDLNAATGLYSAALSQFALARTYQGEILMAQGKFDQANSLFQESAAAGETTAMLNLADLYTGYSAKWKYPVHFSEAKHWLLLAAQRGDGIAMFRLGLLYGAERSSASDTSSRYARLAFNLFQRSALSGYRYAEIKAASFYDNGIGTLKNPRMAKVWRSRAR